MEPVAYLVLKWSSVNPKGLDYTVNFIHQREKRQIGPFIYTALVHFCSIRILSKVNVTCTRATPTRLAQGKCYKISFHGPLSHSSVEALTVNVIVFENGAFGRWLGLDDVLRMIPWNQYPFKEHHQKAHSIMWGQSGKVAVSKPRR
jgi:hypothetical protein